MPSHQYQFIDPTSLFQTVDDDLDLFRELSTIFVTTAPPAFDRLVQAIEANDSKVAYFESHTLKGSSSLIGAASLSALLEDIERHSRQANPAMATTCLPELVRIFAMVIEEIQTSILHFQGPARQPSPSSGQA